MCYIIKMKNMIGDMYFKKNTTYLNYKSMKILIWSLIFGSHAHLYGQIEFTIESSLITLSKIDCL